jgi:hypothetical protein
MAGFPSNTLIGEIHDLISDGTATIALYTSNPTASNSGNEVSGGDYARQTITFGAASGGTISNSNEITFAGLPSATITHYAIFLDGTFKVFGPLPSSLILEAGDQAQYAIGALDVNVLGA